MSVFTPGPWQAHLYQVGGPDNVRVADCYNLAREHDTVCANARLIAAAPDLLEALEAILGPDGPHAPRRTLDQAEQLRAAARAAIAKARGDA